MHSSLTAALPYRPDHLKTHDLHVGGDQRGVYNTEKGWYMKQQVVALLRCQKMLAGCVACTHFQAYVHVERLWTPPLSMDLQVNSPPFFGPPPPPLLPLFPQTYKASCLSETLFTLVC